ncbi:MAG: ABC transporter substrate-binding protein [Oscillospiraceae bacterium]|nr:ABC transporter substrate-binding protein [Oscillospiraceae bacterium]MCL2164652.1 ABC transporter substrate-binding protein [Oscillospiraceae bacterium]
MEDKRTMTGFEVELANLISDRMGEKPSIELLALEDIPAALENGSVSCVISSLEQIHVIMEKYDETAPFIEYGTVIVKLADDGSIINQYSLTGKQVGTTIGTSAEALCEEFLKEIFFDLRKYDLPNQPFQELWLKKKDAAVVDEFMARYYEKNDPQVYKILDLVFQGRQYGIRLSKTISEEKAEAITDALQEIKTDGALSELYMKWFDFDFTPVSNAG